jgi:hypothetical protein
MFTIGGSYITFLPYMSLLDVHFGSVRTIKSTVSYLKVASELQLSS